MYRVTNHLSLFSKPYKSTNFLSCLQKTRSMQKWKVTNKLSYKPKSKPPLKRNDNIEEYYNAYCI